MTTAFAEIDGYFKKFTLAMLQFKGNHRVEEQVLSSITIKFV